MTCVLALAIACCPRGTPGEETGGRPDGDSDGDGIPDEQERAEGTDPDDPTSASAWHPEWTVRPRLLLDPGGLEGLAALLEANDDPWATLAERLRAGCQVEPPEWGDDLAGADDAGNVALACAVLFAGGEPEAGGLRTGERAASMIESLPTSAPDPHGYSDKVDLHAGQALLQGARAWDLLVAAGYPTGHDPAAGAARLHALGEWLWDFYVVDWPVYLWATQNNHNTKLAAAFGLLGMGLYDDPRSARYVAYAATEIPRVFDLLLASDGTCAEGPAYLVYGWESVWPWLIALDRWLGDGSVAAWSYCEHSLDPDCVPGPVEAASPLRSDTRVCAAFDRYAEALMPAGYGPNVDDANLSQGQLGLSASTCGSGAQAWGWDFQADPWVSGGSVDLSADTLLAWTGGITAEPPEVGLVARPDGGTAVLRSGLDRDAAYALLLAEGGAARTGGRGHEHPDALSFLWAARGAYLLVDSGYGHFEVHDLVIDPQDHNVVLIDGHGSEGIDAALSDGGTIEGAGWWVSATVTISSVEWTRELVLAGDRTLVVSDRLLPLDGSSHDYVHMLHGIGEEVELDDAVARWEVEGIVLETATVADVLLERVAVTGWHGTGWELEPHAAVRSDGTGGEVRIVTVARAADAPGELTVEAGGVRFAEGWAGVDGTLVWE